MNSKRVNSDWTLAVVLAVPAMLASGCSSCSKEESKATVADAAPAPPVTVNLSPAPKASAALMPAGALTKFLPKDGAGGYKRVISGEKEGYVEAKLQKDGKEVAIISITDAERMAYAKARFDGVTEKLLDYPLTKIGDSQSLVLVKDRFQVKVVSTTLDHEARKAILATFDLAGLGT